MSQTQPTQDMKSSSSNVLRRRGRPSKIETTLETSTEITAQPPVVEQEDVIDLESLYTSGAVKTEAQIQKEVEFFNKMKKLDYAVEYANSKKIEWLEVDEEILKHLYKGKIHDVGYYIYKGVKLCLAGRAEELAKRDNLSCHEILFPKESYMKVGVRRVGE